MQPTSQMVGGIGAVSGCPPDLSRLIASLRGQPGRPCSSPIRQTSNESVRPRLILQRQGLSSAGKGLGRPPNAAGSKRSRGLGETDGPCRAGWGSLQGAEGRLGQDFRPSFLVLFSISSFPSLPPAVDLPGSIEGRSSREIPAVFRSAGSGIRSIPSRLPLTISIAG